MKILIVEDEYAARAMIEFFLEPYGKIDSAANGSEAVNFIKKSYEINEPYNLVCIDIRLPDMDGHEVLVELKRMESDSGIPHSERTITFMTTALEDPKNVARAFYNLCDEYLSKPVRKNELDELIVRYKLV
ncbi:response regulator [Myxococcota bacterium]|nr:response regulator [Myxococcota bacterium]MBU1380272.1 response regulator [Myxococcota bacterium]MBU1496385.1 response regulator [Myxococcota bacterium]